MLTFATNSAVTWRKTFEMIGVHSPTVIACFFAHVSSPVSSCHPGGLVVDTKWIEILTGHGVGDGRYIAETREKNLHKKANIKKISVRYSSEQKTPSKFKDQSPLILYHCQRLPQGNNPLLPLPISLNVPSHMPWSPSTLRKLNEWGWIGLGCTSRNVRAICHNISSCAESIESVFAQFLGGFNALMEHQTLWVSILDIIAVFGVAFGQENAYVYAKSIESCNINNALWSRSKRKLTKNMAWQGHFNRKNRASKSQDQSLLMLYHCQRLGPYENSSIHPFLPGRKCPLQQRSTNTSLAQEDPRYLKKQSHFIINRKIKQAKVRIKVFWRCIMANGSDLMRILRFILCCPYQLLWMCPHTCHGHQAFWGNSMNGVESDLDAPEEIVL